MWNTLTLADIKAGGFTEQTWGGACTVSGGTPHAYFSTTIPTYTSKTVINALACNPLRTQSGVDLKISTDLVIVSKRFQLNNVRISSADGQPHTIWFVVPSTESCPTGGAAAISMENTVRFPDGKISALAYAKCPVVFANAGNDPWPGSIYAEKMSGYLAIAYHPVGLPGATGGGPGGAKLTLVGTQDTPVSQRNVG